MTVIPLLLALAAQGNSGQATPARPIDPGSWVGRDDYPLDAAKAGAEGTVGFRLRIDAQGRVTSCETVKSAGPALDSATCGLILRRARFRPARDAAGAAVAGTYSSTITWRLPAERLVPFAPAQLVIDTLAPRAGPAFCRARKDGQLPPAVAITSCNPSAVATEPPARTHWVTQVRTAVLPRGQKAPFSTATVGDAVVRVRLLFEVDAKGVVVRCDPDTGFSRGQNAASVAKDRCALLRAGGKPIFHPSEAAGGLRQGVLEYTLSAEVRD